MDRTARIADDLEARLGRLPWTVFHRRVVLALGVVWVLAGVAANAAAALGAVPASGGALARDPSAVGTAAAAYLLGEVVGVLGGGAFARRAGRRPTLWLGVAVFVVANAAPVVIDGVTAYGAVRLAAGMAGGAVYGAVLDTVQELIPRARRTSVLLCVNGLYWLGGILGAGARFALAQPGAVSGALAQVPGVDWRVALLVAPALALLLAGTCGLVPESPSWLLRRGDTERATAIVDLAERDARAAGHAVARGPARAPVTELPAERGTPATLAAMLRADGPATVRAVVLCASQGFVYGAVLYTLVPLLGGLYHVDAATAAAYLGVFALVNLVGAVTLGRLLDPGGQGMPFAVAHMWAGGLLALTGVLLATGTASAWVIVLLLCAAFLTASPAAGMLVADASARYPAPLRRPAARLLYATGQLGAVPGPLLFGALLGTGDRGTVASGCLVAAVVMIAAGLLAAVLRAAPVPYVPDSPFDTVPSPRRSPTAPGTRSRPFPAPPTPRDPGR